MGILLRKVGHWLLIRNPKPEILTPKPSTLSGRSAQSHLNSEPLSVVIDAQINPKPSDLDPTRGPSCRPRAIMMVFTRINKNVGGTLQASGKLPRNRIWKEN